jgi:hypothetical protein
MIPLAGLPSRPACGGFEVKSITSQDHRGGQRSVSPASRRHRPERPVLLAVDQEFAEGQRLGFGPVGPDRTARSKSGSIRTRRNSARGAGPRPSRRERSRPPGCRAAAEDTWLEATPSKRPLAALLSALPPFGTAALLRSPGPIPLPSGRATARSPPLVSARAGLPPA